MEAVGNKNRVKSPPEVETKISLVLAYLLAAVFYMQLRMKRINTKEHPIQTDLKRIRRYRERLMDASSRKSRTREKESGYFKKTQKKRRKQKR